MDRSSLPVESLQVFVGLVDSLRSSDDVVDTMNLLVESVVDLTDADQAAIVLSDDEGRLHVAASSSERSIDVEEAQIGTDEGPCVDCIRSGEVVEVDDIQATRDRWPEFARTALGADIRAALAVPMGVGTRTIGGLNVFRRDVGRLGEATVTLIQAMSQVATISVVKQIDNDAEISNLQRALESRVVIEQAKGFLAYKHGTSVEDAFSTIRSFARANRIRLRDVAQAIVRRELTL